jgi:hypothetical protein
MPKSYNAKTKLSKKQVNLLMKDKNFKHDRDNDENGDFEVDLEGLTLKEFNKLNKMKSGKPFVVKKGDGIFSSLKRGFNKVGNTLKNTFNEKNMKTAVKTVVPGVVGGLTSLGVGTASTLAGGGPITGAVLGGASGAVTSKLTKDALNKSLGNGIKIGGGVEEVIMALAQDPVVKQTLLNVGLMAGTYLTKKGIEMVRKKIGRRRFDQIQKISNETGVTDAVMQNENVRKGVDMYREGEKQQKLFSDMARNPLSQQTKPPSYSFGDGVVGYGKGISGYKKGGAIMHGYAESIGAIQKPINQAQFGAHAMKAPKTGGTIKNVIQEHAENIGAIQGMKSESQFEKMSRVRAHRKMKTV